MELEDDDDGAAGDEPTPDPDIVTSAMAMGFSENAGKRAALATSNAGPDHAINWIMGHMDDADLNDPLPGPGSSGGSGVGADPAVVQAAVIMGFSENAGKRAALATSNAGPEQAINWIMGHMDDPDLNDPLPEPGADGSSEVFAAAEEANAKSRSSRIGRFELVGFVSHVGKNVGSGHYVCHIRKVVPGRESEGPLWVIHNDRKVALSQNPPLSHGYLYLYRCVE